MRRFFPGVHRFYTFLLYPRPHGLLGLRILLPSQDPRAGLHRQFWWHGRSRRFPWLWLVREVFLCLGWLSFGAWRATWRVVRSRGPAVCEHEGFSLRQQGWRVFALAMGWGIPPAEIYRLRLYQRPETALDYVFNVETSGYHRWRSRSLGLGEESLALLSDKWRQTEVLTQRNIPMAPILARIPRGGNKELAPWLSQHENLFVKTRSGNRGIGAFATWHDSGTIHGRMFDGQRLENIEAIETAWRKLLALDDALIQPCLKNHPFLAPLAVGEDAITVRFISQWQAGVLTCLSATLELPAGWHEKSGHPFFVILPLDGNNGRMLPFPQEHLPPLAQASHSRVMEQLTEESSVPHWSALVEGSFRAHGHFPDVWAIAWDWVVTPEGPLLLEGNAGWGTAILQILQGGFLKTLP